MHKTGLMTACVGLFALTAFAPAHAAGEIGWAKSFTDAQLEANRTHKLIMADFYTDW